MVGWIIPITAVVIVIAIFVCRRIARNSMRKKLLATPISTQWQNIIQKNVPIYNHLPQQLKDQLAGLVNVFIAEKRFEGCGGQEITDEVKLTIAAQACILLLNRKTKYFPKLKRIYVYPATYIAKQASSGGLVGPQARLGESWQHGPVVLAFNSVTGGAQNIKDGRNVVFHEFSHQLDQEDGSADGAPILENRSSYATWAKVLSTEYQALQGKARKRRRSVIRKYGATNPAEFFAVATEAFFEKAKQMKKKQPELYEELKSFYKLDPVEWV